MNIKNNTNSINKDTVRSRTLQRAYVFIQTWANKKHSERQEASQFEKGFLDIFGLNFMDAKLEHKFRDDDGHLHYADLFWPGELLIEMKTSGSHEFTNGSADTQAFGYVKAIERSCDIPKVVIVSDFNHMRLFDLRPMLEGGSWNEEIPNPKEFKLEDLVKDENFVLLQFLAGQEDLFCEGHLEVNQEAAEVLGRLFNHLSDQNYKEHDRTLFIMRVMFCLFAENSHIFADRAFADFILSSIDHGQDVASRLNLLFEILDTKTDERPKKRCPWDTSKEDPVLTFPFVDGGLFGEKIATAPLTNEEARLFLVENCCVKDWSKVSPAIFGALFQSIRSKKDRRLLGEHYTSIENIKKVLNPLFLSELNKEFMDILNERNGKQKEKLKKLQEKLGNLQLLDPACGCGNFLIVAYQELRNLEYRIIKELYGTNEGIVQISFEASLVRKVSLNQLHGIEIDSFPHMIAKTAAWLQDHLANERLSALVGKHIPTIPLKVEAHILQGNALQLDWENCFADRLEKPFDFIFGNPPFNGARTMSQSQKADMQLVFADQVQGFGDLDYVTAWFWKGATYMEKHPTCSTAFVATNSIAQGQHVSVLWKKLLQKAEIHFAHRPFKWDNEAKGQAAVHCVVIGMRARGYNSKECLLWDEQARCTKVRSINPYLYDFSMEYIEDRKKPLWDVPEITIGNQPIDDGNYIFTEDEKNEFIRQEKESEPYFHLFLGSREFLYNEKRYILLVQKIPPSILKKMPNTMSRIDAVQKFRKLSKRKSTLAISSTPTMFQVTNIQNNDYICIPRVSSEKREYIPIGFINKDILVSDSVLTIPSQSLYLFAILTSKIHMIWMRAVAGRLEMRYRYSAGIVYNNFPWPRKPKDTSKIESLANDILSARRDSHACLADLYAPLTMPVALRRAHINLDKAVCTLYGLRRTATDSEILSKLFSLYKEKTQNIINK